MAQLRYDAAEVVNFNAVTVNNVTNPPDAMPGRYSHSPMKTQSVIWLAVGISFASAQAQNSVATVGSSKGGQIKGQVLAEDGTPIPNASVYTVPVGKPKGGIIPLERTDSLGNFLIQGLAEGEVAVHAYKFEDGYPDTKFGFYGNPNESQAPTVMVRAGQSSIATITLGPKSAYLTGSVKDSKTGAAVKATFKLIRLDNENLWISTDPVGDRGEFRLNVPSQTEFRVEVSAKAYKLWRSQDQMQLSAQPIRISPNQNLRIDIRLDKADTPLEAVH
jgi:hypothetical protein